jgi:hypothetical protein
MEYLPGHPIADDHTVTLQLTVAQAKILADAAKPGGSLDALGLGEWSLEFLDYRNKRLARRHCLAVHGDPFDERFPNGRNIEGIIEDLGKYTFGPTGELRIDGRTVAYNHYGTIKRDGSYSGSFRALPSTVYLSTDGCYDPATSQAIGAIIPRPDGQTYLVQTNTSDPSDIVSVRNRGILLCYMRYLKTLSPSPAPSAPVKESPACPPAKKTRPRSGRQPS